MLDVQLKLSSSKSAFFIMDDEEKMGEMIFSTTDQEMTVYHTEIKPEGEGKGLAKMLVTAMADYSRKHELKVIPLCPYVLLQFKRHPNDYADIWKQ